MADLSWGRRSDPAKGWPLQDDGKPEPPAFLCSATGLSMDSQVLISKLNAYSIPVMEDYPSDGSFGNVVLGVPAYGAELYVPETMLEAAMDLIAEDTDDDELIDGIIKDLD
ncbi:MAG: hypothetical protein IKE62_03895 [Oscillospiraceae bacterium]|nr:hypothetical protein [Oscillospiraceae bacterium]